MEAEATQAPRRWAVVAAVAFALVAGALTVRAAEDIAVGTAPGSYADFRDAVYEPTRLFLQGGNPYDVEQLFATGRVGQEFPLYAPHHLLLYAPIAVLPLGLARFVFGAAMLAVLVAFVACSLATAGVRRSTAAVLGVATGVLASTPGRFDFQTGQSTPVIVLGAWLALLHSGTRPRLAGLGLALALIKPVFGLPVLLVLAVNRCWATIRWGVGLAAAAAAPVLVVLTADAGGPGAFLRTLRDNVTHSSATDGMDPVASLTRIDLHSLLAKLVADLGSSAVAVVLFVVVAGVAAVIARDTLEPRPRAVPAATLSLCLVLAMVHQSYDMLFLVPAVVLLLVESTDWRDPRRWVAAIIIAAAFNPFATQTLIERMGERATRVAVATTPVLLLTATIVAAAHLRRDDARSRTRPTAS